MPLAVMVHGFELIKEKLKKGLEERLASTPPENIVPPPLALVGPLLDRYKYISEEVDLSNLFLNLLANAMDKEQIRKAHPSFVSLLTELSPDEARLIRTISQEEILPKLDIKLQKKGGGGWHYIQTNFTLLGEKAKLQNPEFTPAYLTNLRRLGIISYELGHFQESYVVKDHYEGLKNHPQIKAMQKAFEESHPDYQILFDEGIIMITPFGTMFIGAVSRKDFS